MSGALLTAAPASAVPLGTVQAQVSNHRGDAGATGGNTGTTSGYCIRYAPPGGSSTTGPSNWVSSGSEALTAHGRGGRNCPTDLSTSTQSAIGVQPVAGSLDPAAGTPFVLGKITHYNNPISYSGDSDYFKGRVSYNLPLLSKQFDFDWWMWETPNQGSAEQNRDQFKFLNQASDTTIDVGGITYKLVVLGFRTVAEGANCPAAPGAITNEWLTYEGEQTEACLYGQLSQVRNLTINKVVTGVGAPAQSFGFAPTSGLDGSPWKSAFSLSSGQSKSGVAVQGETITVTENAVADPQWSLSNLRCVDGTGAALGGFASYDLANRKLSLTNIPPAVNAQAANITCTFTNHYTTKAKLTLKKTVVGGAADRSAWTLSANTGGGTPELQGVDNGAGVSSSTLQAGGYVLAESGGPGGYVQQGNWVCSGRFGSVEVAPNGTYNLADKDDVTCTATNRFQTGSLEIKKVITDASGFSGTSSTPFTGTWSCAVGGNVVQSGTYTVTTAAGTTVSTNVPAGANCTVTENGPTGNLKDGSYEWAQYVTDGPKTVADGRKTTITVTNSTTQNTGTFTVEKQVVAAEGTPAAGYTGGTAREFTVHYVCTLGGVTVSEGDLTVTTGAPVTGPTVPATSSCALTEPFEAKDGDFADASYEWTGKQVTPGSVVIPKGADATVDATVTNTFTRNLTSLEVTKRVEGAGYTGTGEDFTVDVVCGSTSNRLTLANGQTKSIDGLPVGGLCSVQEVTPVTAPIDAAHEWGAPTYEPAITTGVPLVKGETAEVTVVNHTVPVYGQVSVTKQVEGGGVTAGKSFDVTVTCGPLEFTGTVVDGGTFTTPAGQIPAGSSCTVHEGAVSGGLVDDSYAWDATPVSNDQTVTVAKDQTANVVLTNTTKRVYGSLTIAKELVDPDGVYDGEGFSGGYSCTYGSDTNDGSWGPIAGGEDVTIDGILLGSSCEVTETTPGAPASGDASYTWAGASFAPGNEVVVSAATPNPLVTVTNTIVRQTGSFSIAKTVQGDAAGYDATATFPFSWSCTPASGPKLSGTLDVLPGGSAAPAETIPVGSECTVTELENPAPNTGYTWDELSISAIPGGGEQSGRSVTFTIGDAPVTVNAVNPISKKYGSVEITKLISGDGYTGGAEQTFAATVNCGLDGSFVVPFTTEGSAAQQLPLGAECSVTETVPSGGLLDGSYAWGAAEADPQSFTVSEPDQKINVGITNTIDRVYGSATLQKTLTGPTGIVDPAREYTGTWTCVYGDGSGDNTVSGDWTTTAGASAVTLSDHVLVGSECVATEAELDAPSTDPSFVWATPEITADTVEAGEPALVTVANTFVRESGTIEVVKHVTGDTEGYTPFAAEGKDFTVSYDCSVDGVDAHLLGSVAIADGEQRVLIDGVPYGWTCEISEGAIAPETLKDASYSWGEASVSPASVKLSSEKPSALVEVTNPISQASGTFTVTKTLAGVPGAVVGDDTEYRGAWSCTYDGAVVASGDWVVSDASGGTAGPFGPVPTTSECSITEDAPSDADLAAGWSWTTPVIADPITIAEGDAAGNELEVRNSVEQLWGALQLTKVTEGAVEGIVGGEVVAGAWLCTWTDGEGESAERDGRWELAATGGTASLFTADDAVVPVGADCAVTEDTPIAAELRDASFAWGAPDHGDEVTLADGETAGITVTNTVNRVTGAVIVDKKVTGPAAELVAGDQAFGGTLSCTYDGVVTEYPWTATPDGNAQVSGILATSSCVGVETAPTVLPVPSDPSYQWVAAIDYDGNPAVVPADASSTPTITVTNDTFRLKGDFTIEKIVTGSPDAIAGVDPDAEFTFGYSCVLPEGGEPIVGELTATATTPANLPSDVELPAGTECTVTEPESGLPALADDSYNWGTVGYTVTGTSGTPGDRSVTFEIVGGGAESFGHVLVEASNPVTRTDGSFTTAKTSDPASGSTVQPGDRITYTVTVTPGADSVTVHDVVAVDDLSGVLGKAVLDTEGIVASTGTFEFDEAASMLTWKVGDLSPATGPQTLVYSVTVNADAWDATIGNSVTAGGDVPSEECTVEAPCTTDHHTDPEPAQLTLVKQVDNSAWDGKLKDGQRAGTPADWTLSAAGDGSGFAGPGDSAAIVDQTVEPGAYVLSEQLGTEGNPLLAFYEAGDWTCSAVDPAKGYELSDGVLTLDPGAEVTCTVVNTAQTVDLAIDKRHVVGDENDPFVPTGAGESYPYTITVSNNTPTLVVPDVVVTDELPATLKAAPLESWTVPAGWTVHLSGADADGFGGTVSFTKDAAWSPTDAQQFVFGFEVTTASELPREDGSATGRILDIVNTATVTSGGVEREPEDNTSTEETPVASVKVAAQAICLGNAPWISYEATPYNTQHRNENPIVLIWWTQDAFDGRDPSIPAGDTEAILADGAARVDQIAPPGAASGETLAGKLLWPGAAVDAFGNATAWPGWKKLGNGRWVLDPNSPFAELRESVVVEVRTNPSTAAVEAAPPATPDCNPAPPQPGEPRPGEMATTGFDPSVGLWTAAALLIGGLTVLLFMRRRRSAE